jgi:hypothetical protein
MTPPAEAGDPAGTWYGRREPGLRKTSDIIRSHPHGTPFRR